MDIGNGSKWGKNKNYEKESIMIETNDTVATKEPLVTVICITYNHEKYIRSALNGFVSQKTTFPFEVLVHDDASTDNTASIVREYEAKYPNIIHGVYQTENQYSKGILITKTFLLKRVRGKYIAFCEGDDYWTDEYKLQKQVGFLEENPEYLACVHNSRMVNFNSGKEYLINPNMVEYDVSLKDIARGNNKVYQTASLVVKKYVIEKRYEPNHPSYLDVTKSFGDYQIAIMITTSGKMRYMPDVMSVYRFGVPGSWSMINKDKNKAFKSVAEMTQILKCLNIDTERKYEEVIEDAINKLEFAVYLGLGDKCALKSDYSAQWKQLSITEKLKYRLRFFPIYWFFKDKRDKFNHWKKEKKT